MAKTEQTPDLNDALSVMAQILQEMKSQKTATPDSLETLARGIEQLVAVEKTKTKENTNHPDYSFLNPLGERDNPRPDLKCKMIWVGHKVTKEGLVKAEIDALNRIAPGVYRVTKADGRVISLTVTAKENEAGKLETMSFHFPCKSTEDRHNHAPMLTYLREAMGEQLPRVDYLISEIEKLKAELAAK